MRNLPLGCLTQGPRPEHAVWRRSRWTKCQQRQLGRPRGDAPCPLGCGSHSGGLTQVPSCGGQDSQAPLTQRQTPPAQLRVLGRRGVDLSILPSPLGGATTLTLDRTREGRRRAVLTQQGNGSLHQSPLPAPATLPASPPPPANVLRAGVLSRICRGARRALALSGGLAVSCGRGSHPGLQ